MPKFKGDNYSTRSAAARAAWLFGLKQMVWRGEVYWVRDQGRKVARSGLLNFEASNDCEQFCGDTVESNAYIGADASMAKFERTEQDTNGNNQ